MEADKITVKKTAGDTITHIDFRHPFDVKPLVFTLTDDAGNSPASLRVVNITKMGFDIYSIEPQGEDGLHGKMSNIPYIAIEPGEHQFPDGTKIVASTVDTKKFQSKLLSGSSWESVNISGFNTTPIVLAEIQTRNNERTDEAVPDSVSKPWFTAIVDNVSSSSFNIALERSETIEGNISQNETIAYLVIDSGLNGDNHYFGANNGDKIEYESIRTDATIKGWDKKAKTINFSKKYTKIPIVVATKNSRNESDGGWLRRGTVKKRRITLKIDEDLAADSERSHNGERAGILLFSKPFDVEFVYNSTAKMVINEVLYKQTTKGNNNDEFVELYVKEGGDIKGFILSDQDAHFYRFPSCNVQQGDYVIHHTGGDPANNSCSGHIKHFYQGTAQYWNDSEDDVLLIKPDIDVTITKHSSAKTRRTFNGKPVDYIAYGRNSAGGGIDGIPTSMKGVTLSFDYDKGSELKNAQDGQSISLTPNATDSNKAACWELTASGNANDNGCEKYIITADTNNNNSQTNSIGQNNNNLPKMHITKNSIVLNDPVNGATNAKRIPGSTIRYCFVVDNTGKASAENVKIKDDLTGDGKDNLSYIKSGYKIQNINTNCDCKTITDTSGSISGSSVTINLGTITAKDDDADHARACAYIETTVN